jgi:hypothetical protein
MASCGNEIAGGAIPPTLTPLHRAVGGGLHELAALLLDRGANVHAVLSSARGLGGGFWTDLQAIDLAIWDGRRPGDHRMIRLLLVQKATILLDAGADISARTRNTVRRRSPGLRAPVLARW